MKRTARFHVCSGVHIFSTRLLEHKYLSSFPVSSYVFIFFDICVEIEARILIMLSKCCAVVVLAIANLACASPVPEALEARAISGTKYIFSL